jgi:adenylate cyclase
MQDEGLPPLETAFGLNAGEVVVGNIGSQTRTKYGIVGGPVNLTSRIQAQAEGGEILVSQSVYDLLGEDLVVPRSFKAMLKGLEDEVALYQVEGFRPCADQGLPNQPANSPGLPA